MIPVLFFIVSVMVVAIFSFFGGVLAEAAAAKAAKAKHKPMVKIHTARHRGTLKHFELKQTSAGMPEKVMLIALEEIAALHWSEGSRAKIIAEKALDRLIGEDAQETRFKDFSA